MALLRRTLFSGGFAAALMAAGPTLAHHGWSWTEDGFFELEGVMYRVMCVAVPPFMLDVAVPAYLQEGGTYVIPGHGRVGDEADILAQNIQAYNSVGQIEKAASAGARLRQHKNGTRRRAFMLSVALGLVAARFMKASADEAGTSSDAGDFQRQAQQHVTG